MYDCVCVCVCVCVCKHARTHTYIWIHMHVYNINTYFYTRTFHSDINAHMNACMHSCTCMNAIFIYCILYRTVCACMCVYTRIHTVKRLVYATNSWSFTYTCMCTYLHDMKSCRQRDETGSPMASRILIHLSCMAQSFCLSFCCTCASTLLLHSVSVQLLIHTLFPGGKHTRYLKPLISAQHERTSVWFKGQVRISQRLKKNEKNDCLCFRSMCERQVADKRQKEFKSHGFDLPVVKYQRVLVLAHHGTVPVLTYQKPSHFISLQIWTNTICKSICLASWEQDLVRIGPGLPQGLCKIGQEFRHGWPFFLSNLTG
jgi:hypothetical protein